MPSQADPARELPARSTSYDTPSFASAVLQSEAIACCAGTEPIRIGGIYALQRIMQDSPRDQRAAIQVLAAFVREQAPRKNVPSTRTYASSTPAIDVQTALTVLATRNPAIDGSASIDLTTTNLSGANLYGADLAGVNLTGADLASANLRGANVSGADLYGANVSGANLAIADVTGANLTDARPTGANLWSTSWCPAGKPDHPGGYVCTEP